MSLTALPTTVMTDKESSTPFTTGFNSDLAGKRAECEGGAPIANTKYAGRQFFAGTLSGDYRDFDFGGYPWRWYLMVDLTQKPEAYSGEAVWCEEESLTLVDE